MQHKYYMQNTDTKMAKGQGHVYEYMDPADGTSTDIQIHC